MLTGALAMGLPVLNGVTTGDWFLAHLSANHSAAAWVDLGMLICGAITVAAGYLSPSERKTKRRPITKIAADPEAAAIPAE